jgi:flagellum-specific peptidoglycan hydrolase FlgJ
MPAPQAFAARIATDAIQACLNTGVWPSVVLAQAIEESGSGGSKLAAYNNLFGHMASATWFGQRIQLVPNGKFWRVYSSIAACISAHISILKRPRYFMAGVTQAKTPEAQAAALQSAGYNEGPDRAQYAAKLITIIRQLDLKQYDAMMENLERKKNSGQTYQQLGPIKKLSV